MYLTFVIIKRSNSPTQGGRAGAYEAAKPEGRAGRGEDEERRGEKGRRSEAIRGDPRARSHDEREATRLGGRGERVGQRK